MLDVIASVFGIKIPLFATFRMNNLRAEITKKKR